MKHQSYWNGSNRSSRPSGMFERYFGNHHNGLGFESPSKYLDEKKAKISWPKISPLTNSQIFGQKMEEKIWKNPKIEIGEELYFKILSLFYLYPFVCLFICLFDLTPVYLFLFMYVNLVFFPILLCFSYFLTSSWGHSLTPFLWKCGLVNLCSLCQAPFISFSFLFLSVFLPVKTFKFAANQMLKSFRQKM